MISLTTCHILMPGQDPLASFFNAHSIALSCLPYASDQDTFNSLHAFVKIEIILFTFVLS